MTEDELLDHISSMADAPAERGQLVVVSVIRITAAEQARAVRNSSKKLVEELPDILETWLIDGSLGERR